MSYKIKNPSSAYRYSHADNVLSEVLLGEPQQRISIGPATVTSAAINYIGSISLPSLWFERGVVLNGEVVRTMNLTRMRASLGGEVDTPLDKLWMTTYAIRDHNPDFHGIRSNGGAAQRLSVGDKISIDSFSYQQKGPGYLIEDAPVIITLNDDNIIECREEVKITPDDHFVAMYSGKLHRIIPRVLPPELSTIADSLNSEKELVMLVDREIARKARFNEGDYVDFLMVYKNVRETVRVAYTNIRGHMSLHGHNAEGIAAQEFLDTEVLPEIRSLMFEPNGQLADENTCVAIKYQMMSYADARLYSDWITEHGYPNLVIFDSQSSIEAQTNVLSSIPSFPYISGRAPTATGRAL